MKMNFLNILECFFPQLRNLDFLHIFENIIFFKHHVMKK